jgi:hypothetical protein
VKWAYTPPAQAPKPKARPAPPPETPRHTLTGLPRPRRVSVQVVKSQVPDLPVAPAFQQFAQAPGVPAMPMPLLQPGVTGDARTLAGLATTVPDSAASAPSAGAPGAAQPETRGNWVYDPVQERYAFRAERLPDPRNRYQGNNRIDMRSGR